MTLEVTQKNLHVGDGKVWVLECDRKSIFYHGQGYEIVFWILKQFKKGKYDNSTKIGKTLKGLLRRTGDTLLTIAH